MGSSFFAEVYLVSPHTSTVITGLMVSLKKDKLERIQLKQIKAVQPEISGRPIKMYVNLPVIAFEILSTDDVDL